MSLWHEPISPEITHSRFSSDRRVRALIRRRDHFGGLNSLSFMRYTGTERPLMPDRQADLCVVLRPREEITAGTLPAAEEISRSMLEQIGSGELDHLFEISAFQPKRLERVREIDPPSGKIKALILRHSEDKYEVRYFGHELIGVWQKSQTEEWDWTRTRWDTATFANGLAEAEEVAQSEMEQLASAERQTGIRDWFAWVDPGKPDNQQE